MEAMAQFYHSTLWIPEKDIRVKINRGVEKAMVCPGKSSTNAGFSHLELAVSPQKHPNEPRPGSGSMNPGRSTV